MKVKYGYGRNISDGVCVHGLVANWVRLDPSSPDFSFCSLFLLTHRLNRGSVQSVTVMIADIEPEREENFVPYKHLHASFFSGIDGQDVSVDYSLSTACSISNKIWMNLKHDQFYLSITISISVRSEWHKWLELASLGLNSSSVDWSP